MRKQIVFALCFVSLALWSQDDNTVLRSRDSLLNSLSSARHDTDNAKTYYLLAKLYNESDPRKGNEYLKQGYELSLTGTNYRVQSDITNQLGYNYYYLSDFNHSVEFFLKTLAICEKQKNKRGIAACHNNIGSIYLELDDTAKALKHHLMALKIRKENAEDNEHGKNDIAMSYGNVGKTYFAMHDFEKAMEYYKLSLLSSKEDGNRNREALMLNNIGSVLAEQKKYDEAYVYYTNACRIYKELDSPANMALCLNNIAEIHFRKKEYGKSIENYEASLSYSEKLSALSDMKSSYDGLHNCYLQLNDYKLAHDYLLKYIETKDSIFSEENSAQINELLARFDSDKKEQEIVLLQKDKEISLWLRNSLVVGSVLLIFLAFSLYSRYRVKHKANEELSLKNRNIEEQKQIVEHQKLSLEVHQKEIVDSINYARRIQYALLANTAILKKNLPEHFVLFNPKDIVSGDFYWAAEHNDYFYLAVCDSTGHGVPGAFMSLLNIGFLSEAIKEKNITQPHAIFNYVRQRLIDSISKEEQQDGMDGILLCIHKTSGTVSYAAANNSPVLIRNGELMEMPKDKMPVGKGEKTESFKLYTIDLQKGDNLYLYTDGYADQFGGPTGKKFKYKQLNTLLAANSELMVGQQSAVLSKQFLDWKGRLEQVDDVCVIGIKL
jgi:serine phosphatase RsbU (regulator of sigma subunit)/Tfp pilus assembly protein PilF